MVYEVSQSGLADAHAGLSRYVQGCNSQREGWQSDCGSWSIEADMLLVRHNLHNSQAPILSNNVALPCWHQACNMPED